MKTHCLFAGFALLFMNPGLAQDAPALPGKVASTAVRFTDYPRVLEDGRVMFHIVAPDAKKVEINPISGRPANNGINGLGLGPYEMTKGADGAWVVTTPPAVPGLHFYSVLLDGGRFNDPSSRAYMAGNKLTSVVEVPEPNIDFYLPQDVPHGQVHETWFFSKITQQWRRLFVYAPPGYDTDTSRRYPVLYLRHGGTEDEASWVDVGHANFILDNAIAARRATLMIVVMEEGYASQPGGPSVQPPPKSNRPPIEYAPTETLTSMETVPFVDRTFRTIADRDHRAMAGLSMGSLQSLSTVLHHIDQFSAVGVFSRPPVDNFNTGLWGGAMRDTAAFNREMHVFWWGVGTKEPAIYQSVQDTRGVLDHAGIKYVYQEFPGYPHEWQSWRKQLNAFIPLLFRS